MTQTIEAIYADGVLKPAAEFPLRDNQRVRPTVETIDETNLGREAAVTRLKGGIGSMRFFWEGPLPSPENCMIALTRTSSSTPAINPSCEPRYVGVESASFILKYVTEGSTASSACQSRENLSQTSEVARYPLKSNAEPCPRPLSSMKYL
jgi:predicted DNA-binding antitoxin AbrB/MazE fold protein